jgi:hypothetical protein
MKTIEIKLYNFAELSREAKQKAIEAWRNTTYETGDILHFFSDTCDVAIKEAGFTDPKVQYSLNSCQGDGLSFYASDYNKVEDLLNEVLGAGKSKTASLLSDNYDIKISGNTGNHYCFASTSDIDIYLEHPEDTPHIDKVFAKVCEKLEGIYMDLCRELENNGYADIEYQLSDTAIIENIEANEYDFTEDGKSY